MASLQVPFRLVSLKDNQAFAAKDGELILVDPTTMSDDQYFIHEEGPKGETNSAYKIKNVKTGQAFHLNDDLKVGIADPHPGDISQLLALNPHMEKSKTAVSMRLYSQTENDINWGDLAINPRDPLGEIFRQARRSWVLAGGWEVVKADYDISAGRIIQTDPIFLATETVRNNSGSAQTSEVNLSRSVAETHSFTFTIGFALGVGATIEAGVPLVVDGKITTKLTAKTDFTWGHATTTTSTVGGRVPVQTPPHSKVRATSIIKCSPMEVPCTLHLKSKVYSPVTAVSKVVYHGVAYWDLDVTYENLT